ncbi:hypothetical protein H7S55_14715 [Priestia aryabhattai]|uniref:hypothetical protein n=1 Tax=Priestia aryabhattai TaxID=412384 RepID=UPI001C8D531A|nr:hypothetical protein [Priestia aryabhattai]MBY0001428.1 hypothetical protein [Priestia aryabhattai]
MNEDTIISYFQNPHLLRFSDEEFCKPLDSELDRLIDLVNESFDFPKEKNDEKGKRLEHLATYLLNRINCVEVIHDLRTESNQIDHKVTLGAFAPLHPFLNEIGLNFISECKNQKSKVNVGQVQKVANLIDDHTLKFGVFFSREGIAGKGWRDAEGKRKKIYCKNRWAIISFTFNELVEIKDQKLNMITEMRKKYESLKFEVDTDQISVDEQEWYEDVERVKTVLNILHEKGILTKEELSSKLLILESHYRTASNE